MHFYSKIGLIICTTTTILTCCCLRTHSSGVGVGTTQKVGKHYC